jgi:intracellular septation protein
MQSLLEFAPLVAFIVAYYLGGIYTATSVLMVAMGVLLLIDFVRLRRIPAMHGLSAVLVFAFGAATLLLHDQRFIQWKPTVFFWLVSVAFLLSFWIGDRPLVQRFLNAALESAHSVPEAVWRRLNWLWVVFYAVLGAVNLAVAFNASERTWVNFKVFGLTFVTAVFIALQVLWLMKRADAPSSQEPSARA